jgi:hypothetical protein
LDVPHLGVSRDHLLCAAPRSTVSKRRARKTLGVSSSSVGFSGCGASRGHAFRFGHGGGGALVLLFICVAGFVVLADRERVDERDLRGGCHGLEQVVDEGGELLGGIRKRALHLAEIDGDLVKQDQRGLAAEKLADGVRARRDVFFVAGANALVAGAARQAVRHLAPERAGEQSRFEGQPVGGVGVLPVQGGDADRAGRENGRIDEVLLVFGNALHSTDGVHQSDEGVSLTAAILRPQPDDGGDLSAAA